MNAQKQKLFLDALRGEKTNRIPLWFMRQAGRYLPEYRELRASKGGFLDMVYDPQSACEVTMQPIRRFHMDAAILFSDILVIPHALGQKLDFVPGHGPKLEPIRSQDDLARLSYRNFDNVLSPVYETLRLTSSALKTEGYEDVALIGFAGSPWTVACYMVEGQGSKDFMQTKIMAYQNPQLFAEIIDTLVEYTAQYLIKQVEAGAEALQLFDSWSGVLDATQFKRWVIEPTRKIVQLVREVYPKIPIIGFPKGAGYNYLPYAQNTGVSTLGLDSAVPTDWAVRALQSQMPVQGNLDPFCLFAGGDSLILETEKILQAFGKAAFIFNLGHGIHKDTPIAHVEQTIAAVRDFKVQ
ncbi:MAG: uroporphyrinogen decarboxylase [Alphaproteobacteria bacterium]